ncbi:hypothetical protein [Ramlibacter sp.]|uniref:hypothetical protein n=1 Tax=Ramlibacter sp. TaxID=1917967 RepID=UPI002D76DE68|nr:hypothetical protein [Ramlibacter sp.]
MRALGKLHQPFTSRRWIVQFESDSHGCFAFIEADNGARPRTRMERATIAALRVDLKTKLGVDCSVLFPQVTDALAMLPGGPHVIDGEVGVMPPDDTSNFDLVQPSAHRNHYFPGGPRAVYRACDLLVHDGKSVTALPLIERKALLEQLLSNAPKSTIFVGDLPAEVGLYRAMAPGQVEGAEAHLAIYKSSASGWPAGRQSVATPPCSRCCAVTPRSRCG